MAESSKEVSSIHDAEQLRVMENAVQALLDKLTLGSLPDDLDPNIKANAIFNQLSTDLENLRQFALALSEGDLSKKMALKGALAGSLKNLQSSLNHLTWQTKMISQGDFHQRVDFMGEFSNTFNNMVEKLADSRTKLQQRESELINVNNDLVQEIAERKRIEKILRAANKQLEIHVREIELLQEKLQEQAIHDALTGLFNRRYLQETLIREILRARRETKPVTLIMIDIDKFKTVNDTFGHKAGDIMLQALGKLLNACTRADDIACRFGGEEFVLVLPGASQEIALERAESIRQSFDALRINYDANELHATISLGIAVYPAQGKSGDELLKNADQALYHAKKTGRNRVVLYDPGFQGA